MTAVMSTSLKVVSIAAVCCASTRRLAMVARRFDMRTRSSTRLDGSAGPSTRGGRRGAALVAARRLQARRLAGAAARPRRDRSLDVRLRHARTVGLDGCQLDVLLARGLARRRRRGTPDFQRSWPTGASLSPDCSSLGLPCSSDLPRYRAAPALRNRARAHRRSSRPPRRRARSSASTPALRRRHLDVHLVGLELDERARRRRPASPSFFSQRATRASTIDSPISGTTMFTDIGVSLLEAVR